MTRNITIILLGLAMLLGSVSSQANIITVNTFADDSSACSLRNAIISANTANSVGGCAQGSGTDTVQLASGTYTLSKALVISAGVTVEGASTTNNYNINPLTGAAPTQTPPSTTITLASGVIDRLFVVVAGGSASFIDLYLSGGNAVTKNDPYQDNGGAVWAAASVTASNVQFLNNTAGGQGGAIFLSGQGTSVSANLSTFDNNVAASGASAIGSTCYSAQAAENHTFTLTDDLFFGNVASTSPTVLAPAVQACADVTMTMTNDTFAFNDVGIKLVGSNTNIPVNAASVSLSQLTILGQRDVGIDLTQAVALNMITLTNSVIAFNGNDGNDGTFPNCTSKPALAASNTSIIAGNRTGHGCSLTDDNETAGVSGNNNSDTEIGQAVSQLNGGIYTTGTTVNPNFYGQFYPPNLSTAQQASPPAGYNPGQFPPPGYGGLTGVYFPQPTSVGGILIDVTKSNCASTDQRGVPRNIDANGCTIGAVEPKKLLPVADSGPNLSAAGYQRTVTVSVLGNDYSDETGAGTDGTRYAVARVNGFDQSLCNNLNGGTVSLSSDGTQIIYQPAQPLVTWNGALIPGPGLTTSTSVTCHYYIQDNATPNFNVSQSSAVVTMTVSDIPPVAVNVTYIRPYTGNPFNFNPLGGDSDPDGIDGQLPPAGSPRALNNSVALQGGAGGDCYNRQLVQITTAPTLGTVTGNVMALVVAGSTLTTYYGGNLTYTPSNSFSPFGDTFQYVVLDADCVASNAATVTINTSAPNPDTGGGSFDNVMLAGGLVLLLLRWKRVGAAGKA